MSLGQSSPNFQTLMGHASAPDFEPFVTFQKPPTLQALFEPDSPKKTEPLAGLDTYERSTAIPPKQQYNFPARETLSVIEIDALKKQIANLEREISQKQDQHELEKSEIIKTLSLEFAAQVLDSLKVAEVKFGEDIGRAIGSILEPFVASQIRVKILDSFATSVKNSLTGSELAKVTIHGPAEFHSAIKQAFEANLMQIELIESSTPELTAELNRIVLSTRFQHWSELLGGGE